MTEKTPAQTPAEKNQTAALQVLAALAAVPNRTGKPRGPLAAMLEFRRQMAPNLPEGQTVEIWPGVVIASGYVAADKSVSLVDGMLFIGPAPRKNDIAAMLKAAGLSVSR